jgi:hypothetical protein
MNTKCLSQQQKRSKILVCSLFCFVEPILLGPSFQAGVDLSQSGTRGRIAKDVPIPTHKKRGGKRKGHLRRMLPPETPSPQVILLDAFVDLLETK